ncbi:nicotinate-nucleotide adenylyltransferase [Parasporobacterium paucivorans]|uniref:Probable nicotinate-nucleotide adenylyltransferase n=1 Tax=Parasporobacterium paucivorans DSM 15970 TaxID=1122934 RepID=A0A1M6A4L0_9FIRM|nr:nicotinate-nucleotide adenylyltransferase [Parasporobacterium paucivorans]SHI31474.1 nicotinate-nucleotide adenylyltransferase [Parasporobacterium paucivorans DSM 15970]
MSKRKRVGILGGTFDPIHIGHLILAENAYNSFELDTVWIMPDNQPPHKNNVTSSVHRGAMVNLAIQNNPHFEYCGFELEREGPSFTCETLVMFSELHPENDYFFIIGADSLFSIEQWKSPEVIFSHATILAARREDLILADLEGQINYLKSKFNAHVFELEIPNIGISSTMIIRKIKASETIRYYVPMEVERYIQDNHLYK